MASKVPDHHLDGPWQRPRTSPPASPLRCQWQVHLLLTDFERRQQRRSASLRVWRRGSSITEDAPRELIQVQRQIAYVSASCVKYGVGDCRRYTVMPISPMPRAPIGVCGSGMSRKWDSIFGTSRLTGT